MRIGIAADHGAFTRNAQLEDYLLTTDYKVLDFGAFTLDPKDDYSNFIIPLLLKHSLRSIVPEAVSDSTVVVCGPPTYWNQFAVEADWPDAYCVKVQTGSD